MSQIIPEQYMCYRAKEVLTIDGTLNYSDDVDRGWSVEVAIPWSSMEKYAGTACPPNPGDRWRVNFSRVEWEFEHYKGGYLKKGRRSLRQLGVVADGGDQYARAPHVGIRAVFRHYRGRGRGRIFNDASGASSAGNTVVATWASRPLLSGTEEVFFILQTQPLGAVGQS